MYIIQLSSVYNSIIQCTQFNYTVFIMHAIQRDMHEKTICLCFPMERKFDWIGMIKSSGWIVYWQTPNTTALQLCTNRHETMEKQRFCTESYPLPVSRRKQKPPKCKLIVALPWLQWSGPRRSQVESLGLRIQRRTTTAVCLQFK